jgi:hypothetical protein
MTRRGVLRFAAGKIVVNSTSVANAKKRRSMAEENGLMWNTTASD